jgi:myo-inositol-1(or 4)-monophosphatase
LKQSLGDDVTSEAINRRFEAAAGIVEEAAALAMRMRPQPGAGAATLKGAQDWVTEADGAVESLIAARIAALFPEDDFQGEEGGERMRGGPPSGLRWVVDPIDGTANFARGRLRWCVSLGLLADGEPAAGFVHAPALGERFAAQAGRGATLNGKPIRAAETREASAAMFEIGWGPKVGAADYTAMINRMMALGVAPRTGGCGALALADVACGRVDGYVELSINLWDVAGALPLLAEAGAVVSPFLRDGGMHGAIPLLAAAPNLAQALSDASGLSLI